MHLVGVHSPSPSSPSSFLLLCPPSDDLTYSLRKIYRLKKIRMLRRKNGLMHISGALRFFFSMTLLIAVNNEIVSSNLR